MIGRDSGYPTASCSDLDHPLDYPLIFYLPGFSWDRIHFLPSSWYSALF